MSTWASLRPGVSRKDRLNQSGESPRSKDGLSLAGLTHRLDVVGVDRQTPRLSRLFRSLDLHADVAPRQVLKAQMAKGVVLE